MDGLYESLNCRTTWNPGGFFVHLAWRGQPAQRNSSRVNRQLMGHWGSRSPVHGAQLRFASCSGVRSGS